MTTDDEYAATVVAIRAGDVAGLQRLLADNPGLASSRLGGIAKGRTPLHVVCDWPGYFPNGPRVATLLIEAGADLNDRGTDDDHGGETPLHWTASNDDADVASVLIDAGADLEIPDGSIGTPLENAIGYRCWHVARLLVASGARVDALWHAAALGMLDRLEELLADDDKCTPEKISQAFWHALFGRATSGIGDLCSIMVRIWIGSRTTPMELRSTRRVASGPARTTLLSGSRALEHARRRDRSDDRGGQIDGTAKWPVSLRARSQIELEHKCSSSEVRASSTAKSPSEDSIAVRTERQLEEELTDDQHDHVGKSDPRSRDPLHA